MIIYEQNNDKFRLKEIELSDIENLRVWKNKNKEFFFLKEDITAKQQQYWFENLYSKDDENHMFVVQENDDGNFINIGCMGYRIKGDIIDLYNILRGRKIPSKNSMSKAFNMMNLYITNHYQNDITCVVLKNNPAINWYKKNYLEAQKEIDNHILYKLNKQKLPHLKLEIKL